MQSTRRAVIYLGLAGLIAALAIAGCGGETDDGSDGPEGTGGDVYEVPADKTADAPAPAEEIGPPECIELRANLKEGRCVEGTQRFIVVNRNSTLKLPELQARIVGTETADVISDLGTVTRPNGVFLIVTLELKNRLSAPVEFDSDAQTLYTAGRGGRADEFTPDSDATFEQPDSFLRQGEEIQPGTSQVGTVVFDVPPRAVDALEKTANLYLWNFSDAQRSAARAKLPAGAFRTYAE